MNKQAAFLLVNPPAPSPAEHAYYTRMSPPLGLCYLAASLREAGYRAEVLDLGIEPDPQDALARTLRDLKPRLVGFTLVTQGYRVTVDAARLVRTLCPSATIVVGGSHASYEWDALLRSGVADLVARFEAEDTVVELARHFVEKDGQLDDIAGIAFPRGDEVVLTEDRSLRSDLDTLPFPDRGRIRLSEYGRPGTIMSSRGCVKKCVFCVAGNYEGAYRTRAPEAVVEEVLHMRRDWGVERFYFADNVFTADFGRVQAICALLRKSGQSLPFYCVARLDTVCDELMEELHRSGCFRVEIGVETASQRVVDSLQKGISVERVEAATGICLKHGIQPMFTFQVGLPDDTPESLNETVAMLRHLRSRGAGAYLSCTTPYPGTPIFEHSERFGLHIEVNGWEDFRMTNPVCNGPGFTRNDIRRILYEQYREVLGRRKQLERQERRVVS